jgi:hypothetical protein
MGCEERTREVDEAHIEGMRNDEDVMNKGRK